jgi:hypothetical protein
MDKLDWFVFPAGLAFVGTIAVVTLIVLGHGEAAASYASPSRRFRGHADPFGL